MKTKTKAPESAPSNSFLRTLGELRRGSLVTEASQTLADLVQQVRKTGKKGKLTLNLTLRPSADAIEITATCEPKVPKLDPKATTLFDTEDGGLQRDDPKQTEMFSVVEGAEAQNEEIQQRAVNE